MDIRLILSPTETLRWFADPSAELRYQNRPVFQMNLACRGFLRCTIVFDGFEWKVKRIGEAMPAYLLKGPTRSFRQRHALHVSFPSIQRNSRSIDNLLTHSPEMPTEPRMTSDFYVLFGTQANGFV